jgi:elongation factor P--(R)-beta-lysine ligase
MFAAGSSGTLKCGRRASSSNPWVLCRFACPALNDFRPTASWQNLRLRAELLARVRRFFDERGFLEVETPLLSADVVVDRHLDPIAVTLADDPRRVGAGRQMWLQTSPEFGMKRLMAAGGEAIYQITRSFRAGEVGRLHNPEFTMVEWYRRGDDFQVGMQLLSDLTEALFHRGPAERLTYADAFRHSLGVDPHRATIALLAEVAQREGLSAGPSFASADRDAWLDLLLVERIEPALGRGRPTILCDYPASQAALAQLRAGDPPVAERFELYLDGIELANGYCELLDPAALRCRNAEVNLERIRAGKPGLPEESRLLAAMDEGLPPCTGVALGFDRAVMLIVGATSIAEVLAFPIDRA